MLRTSSASVSPESRKSSPAARQVEEFMRETNRLAAQQKCRDGEAEARLGQVEIELANLEQNMLAGLLSPTLAKLLSEREAEKAELEARLAASVKPLAPSARILPHPALLALFEQKVATELISVAMHHGLVSIRLAVEHDCFPFLTASVHRH